MPRVPKLNIIRQWQSLYFLYHHSSCFIKWRKNSCTIHFVTLMPFLQLLQKKKKRLFFYMCLRISVQCAWIYPFCSWGFKQSSRALKLRPREQLSAWKVFFSNKTCTVGCLYEIHGIFSSETFPKLHVLKTPFCLCEQYAMIWFLLALGHSYSGRASIALQATDRHAEIFPI